MTTINKIKQELLVWSIVVAVFAVLTLVAVNFESIRTSPLFNSSGEKESQAICLSTIVVYGYQDLKTFGKSLPGIQNSARADQALYLHTCRVLRLYTLFAGSWSNTSGVSS